MLKNRKNKQTTKQSITEDRPRLPKKIQCHWIEDAIMTRGEHCVRLNWVKTSLKAKGVRPPDKDMQGAEESTAI